jgi:hypothetical protein
MSQLTHNDPQGRAWWDREVSVVWLLFVIIFGIGWWLPVFRDKVGGVLPLNTAYGTPFGNWPVILACHAAASLVLSCGIWILLNAWQGWNKQVARIRLVHLISALVVLAILALAFTIELARANTTVGNVGSSINVYVPSDKD